MAVIWPQPRKDLMLWAQRLTRTLQGIDFHTLTRMTREASITDRAPVLWPTVDPIPAGWEDAGVPAGATPTGKIWIARKG